MNDFAGGIGAVAVRRPNPANPTEAVMIVAFTGDGAAGNRCNPFADSVEVGIGDVTEGGMQKDDRT